MIRPAKLKDSKLIANIYNSYISLGSASMDKPKNQQDIAQWLNTYTDREGVFVFEEDNNIKGWGIIKKYSDRYGYRFACETSVYVHKDHKQQGIGGKINAYLIDKAKAFNYKHLTAKIFASNTASINFFKKFGYTVVGKQHKIGYVNNKWIDMIIMEKLID
ncbi:MAG TPA: N-acetyltransferase family protein [Crocinitomix sp.]|nr:N-acetyltransferase family protein [Crocinitomix sp.]